MLIAVHASVYHEILETDIRNLAHCVLKLLSSTQSVLVCCIYNAPARSIYQWEQNESFLLLQKLHLLTKTHFCDSIVITGDLNFSNTDWDNMSSENVYESNFLGKLIELKLSNFSSTQLDVLLCNNPDIVIKSSVDLELYHKYQIYIKPCSDNKPILTHV